MGQQLSLFARTPIPTFETFLGSWVVEQQLYPSTQIVQTAFNTLMPNMTQVKMRQAVLFR